MSKFEVGDRFRVRPEFVYSEDRLSGKVISTWQNKAEVEYDNGKRGVRDVCALEKVVERPEVSVLGDLVSTEDIKRGYVLPNTVIVDDDNAVLRRTNKGQWQDFRGRKWEDGYVSFPAKVIATDVFGFSGGN